MDAIAYIRWSTEDQKRGDSEVRQTKLAQDFCDNHSGWTLRETIIESGKSAFHGRHRVGTGKMLDLENRAARGELRGCAILVENLDRMSRRQPQEGINLLTGFTKQGVTIVETGTGQTWDAAKVESDWTLLLMAFIRAGLSYDESKKKSGRNNSAWRKTQLTLRTKDGIADSRISPSWIEVVDGEYQVIESRAEVIRSIFEMAADGMSLKRIKAHLDELGIKKWTRGNSGWIITSIATMLRSRSAVGEYLPQSFNFTDQRTPVGDWKPAFPAIISETLWARAEASIQARSNNPGIVKRSFRNVLASVARCGVCASPLSMLGTTGVGRGQPRRLQCSQYKMGGPCPASATYIYPVMRDALLDNIANLVVDQPISNPEAEARIEAQAELQSLSSRIDNLVDTLSRHPSPAMERAVVDLEARIALQQKLVEKLTRSAQIGAARLPNDEAMDQLNSLRGSLDDNEDARRKINQLLRQLLDGYIFNPSDKTAQAIILNGLAVIEIGPDGNVTRSANALNQLRAETYILKDGTSVSTNPAIAEQAATQGDPLRGVTLDRVKSRGVRPKARTEDQPWKAKP